MILIHTKCRVKLIAPFKNVFLTTGCAEGYYCYAAEQDSGTALFIYTALVEELCKIHGFNGCTVKLFEYFKIMGHTSDIYGVIKRLMEESDTLYIDGIINFRLKNYKSDVAAFFDMMAHADTIKKSFSGFPVKCSISFLE